jgi:hypothetical protein
MYNYNINLFKVDSEYKYYILGFIAADGYISKKSNRVEITLAEKDKDFLESLRDLICPAKKLAYKQKQKAYRLSLDSKEIKHELLQYINTTEKSRKLLFPYRIPDQYLNHFMRGYSDGDGNIGAVRGQRKFDDGIKYYYGLRFRVLGTRQFLQGWVINTHVVVNLAKRQIHKKGDENVYYIEYGFQIAKKMCAFLYKNAHIKLERKYQVYKYISETDSVILEQNVLDGKSHYNTRGIPIRG